MKEHLLTYNDLYQLELSNRLLWDKIKINSEPTGLIDQDIKSDDPAILELAYKKYADVIADDPVWNAPNMTPIVTEYEKGKKYLNGKYGFNPLIDNEEFYSNMYEKQGTWDKFKESTGNFLGRLGITALTKTLASFGNLGDMAYSIFDREKDKGWVESWADNWLAKTANEWEDTVKEEWFPVFKPSDWDERGFFSKLKEGRFWSDEVADGLAFLTSTVIGGRVAGYPVRAFAPNLGKFAIKGNNWGYQKLRSIGRMTGMENFGDLSMWAYNVTTESAMEAAEVYKNVKEEMIKAGTDPETASKIAGENASQTFVGNLGILSISAAAEQRLIFKPLRDKFFGPKFKSFQGAPRGAEISKELGDDFLKATVKKKDPLNRWRNLATQGGKLVGGSTVFEGLWEENAQLLVERLSSTGNLSLLNFTSNFLGQTWDALSGKDLEAQTSIGLGGLIGTIGGAAGLKGTAAEKAKREEVLKTYEESRKGLFEILKTDVFYKDENGEVKVNDEALKRASDKLATLDKNLELLNTINNQAAKNNFLKYALFDFVNSAKAAGVYNQVYNNIKKLENADPEVVKQMGFDPDSKINSVASVLDTMKELEKMYEVAYNPNLFFKKPKDVDDTEYERLKKFRSMVHYQLLASNSIHDSTVKYIDEELSKLSAFEGTKGLNLYQAAKIKATSEIFEILKEQGEDNSEIIEDLEKQFEESQKTVEALIEANNEDDSFEDQLKALSLLVRSDAKYTTAFDVLGVSNAEKLRFKKQEAKLMDFNKALEYQQEMLKSLTDQFKVKEPEEIQEPEVEEDETFEVKDNIREVEFISSSKKYTFDRFAAKFTLDGNQVLQKDMPKKVIDLFTINRIPGRFSFDEAIEYFQNTYGDPSLTYEGLLDILNEEDATRLQGLYKKNFENELVNYLKKEFEVDIDPTKEDILEDIRNGIDLGKMFVLEQNEEGNIILKNKFVPSQPTLVFDRAKDIKNTRFLLELISIEPIRENIQKLKEEGFTNDKPAVVVIPPSTKQGDESIEDEKQKITSSEFKELVRLAKFFLENPKEPTVAGSIVGKYPELFKTVTDIERRRQEALKPKSEENPGGYEEGERIEERDGKRDFFKYYSYFYEHPTNEDDFEDIESSNLNELLNKINAKYDAELTALEQVGEVVGKKPTVIIKSDDITEWGMIDPNGKFVKLSSYPIPLDFSQSIQVRGVRELKGPDFHIVLLQHHLSEDDYAIYEIENTSGVPAAKLVSANSELFTDTSESFPFTYAAKDKNGNISTSVDNKISLPLAKVNDPSPTPEVVQYLSVEDIDNSPENQLFISKEGEVLIKKLGTLVPMDKILLKKNGAIDSITAAAKELVFMSPVTGFKYKLGDQFNTKVTKGMNTPSTVTIVELLPDGRYVVTHKTRKGKFIQTEKQLDKMENIGNVPILVSTPTPVPTPTPTQTNLFSNESQESFENTKREINAAFLEDYIKDLIAAGSNNMTIEEYYASQGIHGNNELDKAYNDSSTDGEISFFSYNKNFVNIGKGKEVEMKDDKFVVAMNPNNPLESKVKLKFMNKLIDKGVGDYKLKLVNNKGVLSLEVHKLVRNKTTKEFELKKIAFDEDLNEYDSGKPGERTFLNFNINETELLNHKKFREELFMNDGSKVQPNSATRTISMPEARMEISDMKQFLIDAIELKGPITANFSLILNGILPRSGVTNSYMSTTDLSKPRTSLFDLKGKFNDEVIEIAKTNGVFRNIPINRGAIYVQFYRNTKDDNDGVELVEVQSNKFSESTHADVFRDLFKRLINHELSSEYIPFLKGMLRDVQFYNISGLAIAIMPGKIDVKIEDDARTLADKIKNHINVEDLMNLNINVNLNLLELYNDANFSVESYPAEVKDIVASYKEFLYKNLTTSIKFLNFGGVDYFSRVNRRFMFTLLDSDGETPLDITKLSFELKRNKKVEIEEIGEVKTTEGDDLSKINAYLEDKPHHKKLLHFIDDFMKSNLELNEENVEAFLKDKKITNC